MFLNILVLPIDPNQGVRRISSDSDTQFTVFMSQPWVKISNQLKIAKDLALSRAAVTDGGSMTSPSWAEDDFGLQLAVPFQEIPQQSGIGCLQVQSSIRCTSRNLPGLLHLWEFYFITKVGVSYIIKADLGHGGALHVFLNLLAVAGSKKPPPDTSTFSSLLERPLTKSLDFSKVPKSDYLRPQCDYLH